MNRAFLPLWIAVLLPLAGCGDRSATSGPPVVREYGADDASRIVLEAEDGDIEPPVAVMDEPGASGGRCIIVTGGSGKPGEEIPGDPDKKKYPERWGAAVYKFKVTEPGKYRIWARKWWEDGCGNSFTFVVNGGYPVLFGGDSSYDAWEWAVAPVLFDLKAGENALEVLNREDGVRLDKLIITKDADFVPQGKE